MEVSNSNSIGYATLGLIIVVFLTILAKFGWSIYKSEESVIMVKSGNDVDNYSVPPPRYTSNRDEESICKSDYTSNGIREGKKLLEMG